MTTREYFQAVLDAHISEEMDEASRILIGKLDASDDAITAMLGAEREAELIALLDELADFIRKDLH